MKFNNINWRNVQENVVDIVKIYKQNNNLLYIGWNKWALDMEKYVESVFIFYHWVGVTLTSVIVFS